MPRKNPHLGSTLDEWLADERRDAEFAALEAAAFDSIQLARRVRALREKARMSQEELAVRVGTKQPAIARLESGRVIPTLDILQRIAHALGMHLDVRFTRGEAAR